MPCDQNHITISVQSKYGLIIHAELVNTTKMHCIELGKHDGLYKTSLMMFDTGHHGLMECRQLSKQLSMGSWGNGLCRAGCRRLCTITQRLPSRTRTSRWCTFGLWSTFVIQSHRIFQPRQCGNHQTYKNCDTYMTLYIMWKNRIHLVAICSIIIIVVSWPFAIETSAMVLPREVVLVARRNLAIFPLYTGQNPIRQAFAHAQLLWQAHVSQHRMVPWVTCLTVSTGSCFFDPNVLQLELVNSFQMTKCISSKNVGFLGFRGSRFLNGVHAF